MKSQVGPQSASRSMSDSTQSAYWLSSDSDEDEAPNTNKTNAPSNASCSTTAALPDIASTTNPINPTQMAVDKPNDSKPSARSKTAGQNAGKKRSQREVDLSPSTVRKS